MFPSESGSEEPLYPGAPEEDRYGWRFDRSPEEDRHKALSLQPFSIRVEIFI
jgi:hypothetical protein